MKLRAGLVVSLVVPSVLSLTGPVAPTYAAAVCQGRAATIEGASGNIDGTPGNDVIVSTGTTTHVNGLGGDDLICVVGGDVDSGGGNDSILSTAPDGILTTVNLVGDNVSYVSTGAGRSVVSVDQVTSVNITMGAGGGAL